MASAVNAGWPSDGSTPAGSHVKTEALAAIGAAVPARSNPSKTPLARRTLEWLPSLPMTSLPVTMHEARRHGALETAMSRFQIFPKIFQIELFQKASPSR